MTSYPFPPHHPDTPEGSGADSPPLAGDESLVELRCSTVVVRSSDLLLLRRVSPDGGDEWVLPGGRPRPGEGMLSCARREVAEETGVTVVPTRCAFIADVIAPNGKRRCAELVFLARVPADYDAELSGEVGVEPRWVSVDEVRTLRLMPPIAGFLPDLVRGRAQTAPHLGNLWRSDEGVAP